MAKEVIERKSVGISYGSLNVDNKLKAPEIECIRFSVPVTADNKKMQIDELEVNKREMGLEVLMADNPSIPAKRDTLKAINDEEE
ncbi:hypothetical protein L1987_45813 [Smallanthus sonchifolius]|uniref:Uncharacterized protein n=1 Tax=Smallanthus sonchifolius TaxID=185202 RepID=A0ACB9FYM5_9ASTR|nr:hypothetical protein L1987_45813 [Smallanthus sonchifolius]